MRAAPPVSASLLVETRWVWAMRLLGTLYALAWLLWWGQWFIIQGWAMPWQVHAVAVLGLLSLRVLTPMVQTTALHLRWDGEAWHWMPAALWEGPGTEAFTGQLRVALDFPGWKLLRLQSATTPGVRWVAVSQHSAGSAWHGLCCAWMNPNHPSKDA